MNRREFLKGTAWMGAAAFAAGCRLNRFGFGEGGQMQNYAYRKLTGRRIRVGFIGIGRNDVEDLRKLVVATTGLEPETLYCVPPVVNNPDNPLILDFKDAMARFWPSKPPYFANANGATDAFQFVDLNLPIVIVTHDSVGGHKPIESGSLKSAEEYLNFFVGWISAKAAASDGR